MHTVRLMSNYIKANVHEVDNREELVHDLLYRYHAWRATERAKEYCVEQILLHLYFLLPHILASKKIPPDFFDDALQNMSLSVMKAIDKFDPRRGTKFTAYLVGYFKDALSTTFKDNNVVKAPIAAKQKPTIPIQTHDEYTTLDAVSDNITLKNQNDALSPVTAEQHLINKELLNFLEYALSRNADLLDEKEALVITYKYGLFGAPVQTLDGIAKMFAANGWKGTKVWVFQVQNRAQKKLRRYFSTNQVGPLPL